MDDFEIVVEEVDDVCACGHSVIEHSMALTYLDLEDESNDEVEVYFHPCVKCDCEGFWK
jgi:hypothetical protein